jgi:hypothetical protein
VQDPEWLPFLIHGWEMIQAAWPQFLLLVVLGWIAIDLMYRRTLQNKKEIIADLELKLRSSTGNSGIAAHEKTGKAHIISSRPATDAPTKTIIENSIPENRIFISSSLEEITLPYREYPTHQADKLFEVNRNKWLLIESSLSDVILRETHIHVLCRWHFPDEDRRRGIQISASFPLELKDSLSHLKRNDIVSMIGQIREADAYHINLVNCELAAPKDDTKS